MEKLLKFYVIFDLCCLISLILAFFIYVSIMLPPMLFFTIPAVIFIICISIKSIKTFIYERKVVNELLNFDTIEEGIECLTIAQNMVFRLNQNNDTIYATRIQLICEEQIIKKLNDMGWEGE
jgi:hypothetical protein